MSLPLEPCALIVEDDPIILMDAVDILEGAGFRVLEATSGDEAKVVLADQGGLITLLFSDVEMPGATNGFALAQLTAAEFPHIEIVIASGRIQPQVGDMPDKATFLPKPFNSQIVRNHLREKLPDDVKPVPLKD